MIPEIVPGSKLSPATVPSTSGLSLDLNLPNLITLARLLCVPLAVWLILDQRHAAAFWVFVAAGVSDGIDGYIAKRFNRRTRLGAMLDPAADKLLLAGVYLTLGYAGHLPAWLVFVVILRDLLIALGFATISIMAGAARPEVPLYISKINTFLQITLIGVVLARLGLGIDAGTETALLVAAAGFTTVLSGFSYLWRWARLMRRSETVP